MKKLQLSLVALLLIAGTNTFEAKTSDKSLKKWNKISNNGQSINQIKDSQIKNLKLKVINVIPSDQMKQFSRKQVEMLSRNKISGLSTSQLVAILDKISTNKNITLNLATGYRRTYRQTTRKVSQFTFLTSNQIKSLKGKLTPDQLKATEDREASKYKDYKEV